MATAIKQINNRIFIEFDKGKFDNWCVYIRKTGCRRYAPFDRDYFRRLKELSERHTAQKIYNDFLSIYHDTDRHLNPVILKQIDVIAESHAADAEEINIWFTVIYAGMIAEENKLNSILKKRIKRLGLHQLLLENMPPEAAAGFSKNRTCQELEPIMRARGI